MCPITTKLKETRKSQGISQKYLADCLKIKRQFISEWERSETNPFSKTSSPSLRNLQKWADFFGYEIELKPKRQ